ncbi:MAG: RNA polymerase sigma factor [Bacteroidales bacterium]|nr:RNA polymerase sigma factor [Bacteroidales bacterium]
MIYDDSNIIEGCRKNKHRFQMALYDKYAAMLRAVCLRYVKNDADADDLLQEGFIKILQNVGNYVETGSFKAWMKRIMVNQAINFLKKKKQIEFTDLTGNEDYNDDESYNPEKTENKLIDGNIGPDKILELMKQLPEDYRMVLNLYVIDGFSHKEIADQLGISINTSKSQLSRARKALLDMANELLTQNKLSYEKQF